MEDRHILDWHADAGNNVRHPVSVDGVERQHEDNKKDRPATGASSRLQYDCPGRQGKRDTDRRRCILPGIQNNKVCVIGKITEDAGNRGHDDFVIPGNIVDVAVMRGERNKHHDQHEAGNQVQVSSIQHGDIKKETKGKNLVNREEGCCRCQYGHGRTPFDSQLPITAHCRQFGVILLFVCWRDRWNNTVAHGSSSLLELYVTGFQTM